MFITCRDSVVATKPIAEVIEEIWQREVLENITKGDMLELCFDELILCQGIMKEISKKKLVLSCTDSPSPA